MSLLRNWTSIYLHYSLDEIIYKITQISFKPQEKLKKKIEK